MIQIDVLYDPESVPEAIGEAQNLLTEELQSYYAGSLSFDRPGSAHSPIDRPFVISNFVSSLDGEVSYAMPGHRSGAEVSGGDEADQFIMGILRACADAVVMGAETVAAEGGRPRTAEEVYPAGARAYAALRAARGKPLHPLNVVLSRSGKLDSSQSIFQTPGLPVVVLTTEAGKRTLDDAGGVSGHPVIALGQDGVSPEAIRGFLQSREIGLCLLEGGPTIMGEFLKSRMVDEMFLTWSPRIVGRDADHPRPGMVQSAFSPVESPVGDLISLRRHESFLFSRYRIRRHPEDRRSA